MNNKYKHIIRGTIYIAALTCLATFIVKQGISPWRLLIDHWQAMLSTMCITAFGIVVQANAFRFCLPNYLPKPNLLSLLYIWSTGAITSFLAPVITGLALRAVMLKRENIDIKVSAIATLRQTLLNVEYAILAAGLVLIGYPWPRVPKIGLAIIAILAIWCVTKQNIFKLKLIENTLLRNKKIQELFEPPKPAGQIWLWGQLIAMALNYYAVFFLFGIPIAWHESLLLSSITIIAGLAFIFPNGVGILDALWVWVASRHGFTIAESASVVLTMRLGFLSSAILLWLILRLRKAYI